MYMVVRCESVFSQQQIDQGLILENGCCFHSENTEKNATECDYKDVVHNAKAIYRPTVIEKTLQGTTIYEVIEYWLVNTETSSSEPIFIWNHHIPLCFQNAKLKNI